MRGWLEFLIITIKPQWVGMALIGLVLIAYFIQEHNTDSFIDECPRYTIGHATTIDSKKVNYSYSFMGQSYSGVWYQKPRSIKDYFSGGFAAKNFYGKRFLIKVSCQKPDVSKIDWTHFIPSWIDSPPDGGWTTLPIEFHETEFAK